LFAGDSRERAGEAYLFLAAYSSSHAGELGAESKGLSPSEGFLETGPDLVCWSSEFEPDGFPVRTSEPEISIAFPAPLDGSAITSAPGRRVRLGICREGAEAFDHYLFESGIYDFGICESACYSPGFGEAFDLDIYYQVTRLPVRSLQMEIVPRNVPRNSIGVVLLTLKTFSLDVL